MKLLITGCLAGLLTLGAILPAASENWPAWRGPEATGVTREKDLPLSWSPTRNVRWHVALPGPGNSSPIVWGDRVFVTQFVKAENRRTLLCFERASGKQLWQAGVVFTVKEATHGTNPYCAASPVTDGERVIASFGSAGLYCYDFAGQELWHREFGTMNHVFGNASSPLLTSGLCVLNFGPDAKNPRLIAVDKQTGKTVWEALPPKVDPSEQQPRPQAGVPKSKGPAPLPGSWATPFVIQAGGREELIMNFSNRLCAYAPQDGKLLWMSKGMGKNILMSPLWGEGVLVAQSSDVEGPRAVAVRPGGSGDVSDGPLVAWKQDNCKGRIGSGVIHGGYAFMIAMTGQAECFDLKTGKLVWSELLSGPGAKKSSWSSMLLAGDKIYVPNQSGDVFVLRAAPKFELLGTNSIGEPTNASLAASDGELFLRTDKALWCLDEAK